MTSKYLLNLFPPFRRPPKEKNGGGFAALFVFLFLESAKIVWRVSAASAGIPLEAPSYLDFWLNPDGGNFGGFLFLPSRQSTQFLEFWFSRTSIPPAGSADAL
jgi:hypothetical protein